MSSFKTTNSLYKIRSFVIDLDWSFGNVICKSAQDWTWCWRSIRCCRKCNHIRIKEKEIWAFVGMKFDHSIHFLTLKVTIRLIFTVILIYTLPYSRKQSMCVLEQLWHRKWDTVSIKNQRTYTEDCRVSFGKADRRRTRGHRGTCVEWLHEF